MSTDLTPGPLGDADLECALRTAFRAGADDLDLTTDPWDRTARAVRRSRLRRRTAAVAVVAAAVVGGLSFAPVPAFQTDRASVANNSNLKVTTDAVRDWPLRGDLARDAGVLAGARAALGAEGTVDHLLWAGAVAGVPSVIAIVTPRTEGGTEGATAPVQQLMEVRRQGARWTVPTPGRPVEEARGRITYLAEREDGSFDVVVLARTDAQVAVSDAVRFDDQGRPSRSFRRLTTVDGVARTVVPRGPSPTISIRTQVPGAAAVLGPADLAVDLSTEGVGKTVEESRLDDATAAAVADSPQCGGSAAGQDVANAVNSVLTRYDRYRQPKDVVALWCRDSGGAMVGLFAVTIDDGTTFQMPLYATAETSTDGSSGSVVLDSAIAVPRGAGATTPWVGEDFGLEGTSAQKGWFVHAPGAARVDLTTVDGTGVSTVVASARPDRDGFAALKVTATQAKAMVGAAERVAVLRDAAGQETARVSLDRRPPDIRQIDGPVR